MANFYIEKIRYLDENYEFVPPDEFYRALFPVGSFQTSKDDEARKGNGILICKKANDKMMPPQIVYDDHAEIRKVINNEGYYKDHKFVFMAPVSYAGKRRLNDNARTAYAMAIDTDKVDAGNIRNLMHIATNIKAFPVPTYLVVSGAGIHVYYVFDEPVQLFEDKYEALDTLKSLITTRLWNKYTSKDPNVQYQPITQAYRMPGSKTKKGSIVRAYKTGNVISVEDIISCLSADEFAEYRANKNMRARNKYAQMRKKLREYWEHPNKAFDELSALCYDMEHVTIEEAKAMYPKWYQRRVIEGQPRGHYTSGKHLYEWWKKRMLSGVTYGHRYHCILVLVCYATRCNIPFEVVEKDAWDMFEYLDGLTPPDADEREHFHREDVEQALSLYGSDELYRYSNKKISFLTKIEKPPENKRSGYNKNGK